VDLQSRIQGRSRIQSTYRIELERTLNGFFGVGEDVGEAKRGETGRVCVVAVGGGDGFDEPGGERTCAFAYGRRRACRHGSEGSEDKEFEIHGDLMKQNDSD